MREGRSEGGRGRGRVRGRVRGREGTNRRERVSEQGN